MRELLKFPVDRMREVKITLSRDVSVKSMIIPKVLINEIAPGPIDLQINDLNLADGNTTLVEQAVILSLAKQMKAGMVFEIGTFDGNSAANLAANLGQEAKIFTLDLPAKKIDSAALPIGWADRKYIQKDTIGARINRFGNIRQLYGDSATFDFSPWFGACDFVFVDACHEYEYVLHDSLTAIKVAKPGGAIIWHDYGTWLGVVKGLNELYCSDKRFSGLRHVQNTTLCVMRV